MSPYERISAALGEAVLDAALAGPVPLVAPVVPIVGTDTDLLATKEFSPMSKQQIQTVRDRQSVLHATVEAIRDGISFYILPDSAWRWKNRDLKGS